MKINKDRDVVGTAAPAAESGTNPFDNPGIKPHQSAIPETPGERAMNSTTEHTTSRAQPFKKKGAGYSQGH